MLLFCPEWGFCYRNIRRYYLYTYGIIGLTLFFLISPLFDAPNEVCERQKIHNAKVCSTGGKDHTRIRRRKAGPSSRQDPHVIRSLVKGDTIFSPIMAIVEDLKLLAVQGMKGMGDRENSFC